PHSSSTVIPEGSRAAAGIGCHFMVQWMDRDTEGFTHMGGEGAQWIGEAPFSTRRHIFQNLGDGTYNHSGSLAIRAAAASGVNITYKVLYNDAVALTGGQALEGSLAVLDIATQVAAEGAKAVAIVTDEPEKYGHVSIASVDHRDDILSVQSRLADIEGVTVLIYDQTCASEKRRRRKRGTYPDPDRRVVINERVCEGCGDCGKVSNCVAIQPVETAFGRKRQIDQSVCNKDFSCVKGLCPSFVTVHGGVLKGAETPDVPTTFPEPQRAPFEAPIGVLVTGVGGTGVVTVGAVIGMAAHLEGHGVGVIDMAGLAQKGGAVLSHIKLAPKREDVTTIRVGPGGAAAVLACDIAVAGSAKVLSALGPDTKVVANTHEQLPGDFTRDVDFSLPSRRIIETLKAKSTTRTLDATAAASRLFGDTIAANTLVLGAAYQMGALPLSAESIERAIALNGAAVAMNTAAFRMGRMSVADPEAFQRMLAQRAGAVLAHRVPSETLDGQIERYAQSLTAYQNQAFAKRFTDRIAQVRACATGPLADGLVRAAADNLYRLMAIKDEYEVARLYCDGAFEAQLASQFERYDRLTIHLAPPGLSPRDPDTGRPKKIAFSGAILRFMPLLARMRRLRGTRFDVFGWTKERRGERALLAAYEETLDKIAQTLSADRIEVATAWAQWPQTVKGYGVVRERAAEAALKRAEALRLAYDQAATAHKSAAA
ncbi:MAG: indolepyruvate ferredoxin oxidoreductase family protein, partial [Pseudomonadota bacterium]